MDEQPTPVDGESTAVATRGDDVATARTLAAWEPTKRVISSQEEATLDTVTVSPTAPAYRLLT